MKEETKATIKEVWEELKVPIFVTGTAIGAFVLGGIYTGLRVEVGMRTLHSIGMLKWFNPETAIEVTEEEAIKLMDTVIKNKKV